MKGAAPARTRRRPDVAVAKGQALPGPCLGVCARSVTAAGARGPGRRRWRIAEGVHPVEPLTCAIGAELSNVNLGAASRDLEMAAEIRALLRKHRVLFLRDRDSLAPSKPSPDTSAAWRITPSSAATDHPGLVPIYKGADTRHPQYESAWNCDAPGGTVRRCEPCSVAWNARRSEAT